MLELIKVSKTYYSGKGVSHRALNEISLSFARTGLVVILGKSGSGKTTLLNLLGGLDRPSQGRIRFEGVELLNQSPRYLDMYRNSLVGFIFQHYNLIGDFTVRENINLALDLQHKPVAPEQIEAMAEALGIKPLLDAKVMHLSGGEQQRVTILRSLLKDAKMILADEPSAALDQKLTADLMQMLKGVAQEKLVVVITHDEDLAQTYGDRIIEIKDGMIFKDIAITSKYQNQERTNLTGGRFFQVQTDVLPTTALNDFLAHQVSETYLTVEHNANQVRSFYPHLADLVGEIDQDAQYKQYAADIEEAAPVTINKSLLRWRSLFRLSRLNLKRKRVQLVITTVIALIAAILYMFSFDIQRFSLRQALAADLAGNKSQYHYFSTQRQLALDEALRVYPDLPYYPSYDLASVFDMRYYYEDDYYIGGIRGYIVHPNPAEMFTLKYGSGALEQPNDVIISEYLAYDLSLSLVKEIDELIDYELPYLFKTVRIRGIYAGDLTLSPSAYREDKVAIAESFNYHCRLLVNEAFVPFARELGGTSIALQWNKMSFTATRSSAIIDPITYLQGDVAEGDNVIYLNPFILSDFFPAYSVNPTLLDELIKDFNAQHLTLNILRGQQHSAIITNVQIRGIVDAPNSYLYLSDAVYDEVLMRNFVGIVIEPSFFKSASSKKLNFLLDQDFLWECAGLSDYLDFRASSKSLSSVLSTFSYFFFFVLILLIYSLIRASIRASKRQLGLVRSLGGGRLDLLMIFVSELLIFTIATYTLTVIVYQLGRVFVNNQIARVAGVRLILIPFNLTTNLAVGGMLFITVSASLLFTLRRIFSKTPVELLS